MTSNGLVRQSWAVYGSLRHRPPPPPPSSLRHATPRRTSQLPLLLLLPRRPAYQTHRSASTHARQHPHTTKVNRNNHNQRQRQQQPKSKPQQPSMYTSSSPQHQLEEIRVLKASRVRKMDSLRRKSRQRYEEAVAEHHRKTGRKIVPLQMETEEEAVSDPSETSFLDRFRDFWAGRTSRAMDTARSALLLRQAKQEARMTEAKSTWALAHQGLHFPVDDTWPPKLPGVPFEGDDEMTWRSQKSASADDGPGPDAAPADPPDSTSPLDNAAAIASSPRFSSSILYKPPSKLGNLEFPINGHPAAQPVSIRNLAALALGVHRFGARPRSQVFRPGTNSEQFYASAIDGSKPAISPAKNDNTIQVVWRASVHHSPEELAKFQHETPESLYWLMERNSGLEYLGDALANAMAKQILHQAFPDLTSGRISTAASHMVTNDTFAFLYELAGLEEMRKKLAQELLYEAVQAERKLAKVGFPGVETGEEVIEEVRADLDLDELEGQARADRFEAYLAFVHLVHGWSVAHEWYGSLIQPWVMKIAVDPDFHEAHKLTPAGAFRKKQREIFKAEERKRGAEETVKRYDVGLKSLAVAGRGLMARLFMRAKGRQGEDGEKPP